MIMRTESELSELLTLAAKQADADHLLPQVPGLTGLEALRCAVEGAGWRMPDGCGIRVHGSPDSLVLRTEAGKAWDARLTHGLSIRMTASIGRDPTWTAYWCA